MKGALGRVAESPFCIQPKNKMKPQPIESEDLDKDTLTIFTLARRLGVDVARYDFSGAGDSGDVNDVNLIVRNGEEEEYLSRTGKIGEEWGPNPHWTPEHQNLIDLCHNYFDSHLSSHISWDWYNNEGGGGVIHVDFATGEVEVTGYYWVEETADDTVFNLLGKVAEC